MEIHLTEQEIVETLKRTSLTTILVEGKEDIIIYRWIEEEIGINNVNFLPCGGRETLLNIFNRRNEFNHIKAIFVADKDTFVYSCIPHQFSDVVWTNGYSIENDLYNPNLLEKLLDIGEEVKFRYALKNFTRYYAFELECFQKQLVYCFSNHPSRVLTDEQELSVSFLDSINFSEPNLQTIENLLSNYHQLIRGKSIFALLIRFLSHTKRTVKHSRLGLYEQCFKVGRTQHIDNLISSVKLQIV